MSDFAPGAWTASLTPLNTDLSIDRGACLAHVHWLLEAGSAGVAVLGTTGEANSFSVAERVQLIAALAGSAIPARRLVIGVGCCAAPNTIALARAALDAGYPNVLMLPPFYYKGVSQDGLFRAFAHVIESVADARLRVLVYDFPQMTGVRIDVALLGRLRSDFGEIVVGVKNSAGDWAAMQETMTRLPNFLVFAGSERFLLPTLRAGGPGCISASANVTSRALAALARDWRGPDADARQAEATRVRQMLEAFPMIPALKEIMAHARGYAGWQRLRPPLVNLAPDQASLLLQHAAEAGVIAALQ